MMRAIVATSASAAPAHFVGRLSWSNDFMLDAVGVVECVSAALAADSPASDEGIGSLLMTAFCFFGCHQKSEESKK